MLLNTEELVKICRKWQNCLGLQQWDIQLRVCRKKEMYTGGDAEVLHKPNILSAVIQILDPQDYEDAFIAQNIEQSIIHELLHIPLNMFCKPEDGSVESVLMEQHIESLSRALLYLDKK